MAYRNILYIYIYIYIYIYTQNCTIKELYNCLKLLKWQTYSTDGDIFIYKIIAVAIYYYYI